ncbi:TVP38/TMEM64 family protein [Desulfothermus naphthae]
MQRSPFLYPSLLFAFIVAGMTMFPVTVLSTATALFIGIVKGLIISLVGCFLSAVVTFFIVRSLGTSAKQYLLSKKKIKKLNKIISEDGLTSIAILRMLPIGYTVISVTAALSDIKFFKYLLGTLIGVFPDLILCIFLAGSLHNIIVSGKNHYIIWIVFAGISYIILWSILLKNFIKKLKKIDL